jgi:hypothetical protein
MCPRVGPALSVPVFPPFQAPKRCADILPIQIPQTSILKIVPFAGWIVTYSARDLNRGCGSDTTWSERQGRRIIDKRLGSI